MQPGPSKDSPKTGRYWVLSRRYEKTKLSGRPLRSKNLFSYCRSMFGWFGEVGGHRKISLHRCALSFSYLTNRNVDKTTKVIFRIFNTCNSSPILLFCPRNPESIFFENTKRRAPEFGSKSAQKIIDLLNYGAIWCQIGSQFLSPKNMEFELEFRLFVPPRQ